MRLMSFAKTWPQFHEGTKTHTLRLKQAWTDGTSYFAELSPGMRMRGDAKSAFWKIWIPAWWSHRNNEPLLKPDEIFEGVEWSPRVGCRWACCRCDWSGLVTERDFHCDACGALARFRPPDRAKAVHHSTKLVELGDGDAHEAALEGFPGMSWAEFCAKHFKGIPLDTKVARIAFERIES